MTKLAGMGLAAGLLMSSALVTGAARADQVFADDVIVQGSLCVGVDCVNGENFGFDTLVLKENNLRIFFNDTSSSSSFPNVDWRLIANETSNGGANMFVIEDSTNSKRPLWIDANSPNNLLYLSSAGRVGIKTSSPALQLHVRDGNSPGLRLEQDGSAGFSAQTWDVAGNETNFFVRDATNAGRIPFKIVPAAPNNSLYIASNGNVGLGTATPDGPFQVENGVGTDDDFIVTSSGFVGVGTNAPVVPLHVYGTTGTAAIQIEDASSTKAGRGLLTLKNNGGSFITMTNSNTSASWFITHENAATGRLLFTHSGGGGAEALLDQDGNLTIAGTLTENSDRRLKTEIVKVDEDAILAKVDELDIAEWSYKTDPDTRHIGPMAQDFYALFRTGVGESKIATIDTSGVALASIKAMSRKLAEKEARLARLEASLIELRRQLDVQH
ncbi:endosialidase-like protein [Breoghania corrubedonensis]|uniref:Endosialidase-like protein n=1 Tax=Breoghania corrubedonensis TaxID=665038 RepID=A0A2T5UW48_9HYPH|nr:tail fiber domain-containing protein [Breoghania corrubedonensis]PTW55737.1 endosialidase-like protein [Breoghania corrubedonensis]